MNHFEFVNMTKSFENLNGPFVNLWFRNNSMVYQPPVNIRSDITTWNVFKNWNKPVLFVEKLSAVCNIRMITDHSRFCLIQKELEVKWNLPEHTALFWTHSWLLVLLSWVKWSWPPKSHLDFPKDEPCILYQIFLVLWCLVNGSSRSTCSAGRRVPHRCCHMQCSPVYTSRIPCHRGIGQSGGKLSWWSFCRSWAQTGWNSYGWSCNLCHFYLESWKWEFLAFLLGGQPEWFNISSQMGFQTFSSLGRPHLSNWGNSHACVSF